MCCGDAGRPSHSSLGRIWLKPLSAVRKFPRRRLVSRWPPHSSSAGFLFVMCHIPRAPFAVRVYLLWAVCSGRERRLAGPARRTWCPPVATQLGSVVSTNACTHRCALHSLRDLCPLALERSQRETSTRPGPGRGVRRRIGDRDTELASESSGHRSCCNKTAVQVRSVRLRRVRDRGRPVRRRSRAGTGFRIRAGSPSRRLSLDPRAPHGARGSRLRRPTGITRWSVQRDSLRARTAHH
jgi:hypothetical protein